MAEKPTIIAMSTDSSYQRPALDAGADSFIDKLEPSQLDSLQMIAKAIVVVVENHDELRQALNALLSLQENTIFAFSTAEEAIEAYPSLNPLPGVVITDISLEGMNGFEFIQAVLNLSSD